MPFSLTTKCQGHLQCRGDSNRERRKAARTFEKEANRLYLLGYGFRDSGYFGDLDVGWCHVSLLLVGSNLVYEVRLLVSGHTHTSAQNVMYTTSITQHDLGSPTYSHYTPTLPGVAYLDASDLLLNHH